MIRVKVRGLRNIWGDYRGARFFKKSTKKVLTFGLKCDTIEKVKQVAFATSTNSDESEE